MAPGSEQCCKPLFLTYADELYLAFSSTATKQNLNEKKKEMKRNRDTKKRKKENELKQSKTLGMVQAAGYFPRVLSKNNLVKMWTENHRPLLSPEHMQL